jgi:pimeloyl-ACP methyl ester carboxylesterase
MRLRCSIVFIVLMLVLGMLHAQEIGVPFAPLPAAQLVTIEAADGLLLKGDFYLVDTAHPTLFLLHELYARRSSWNIILEPLLRSGYNILAVDVRGHGATRGGINWYRALDDTALWFTWLRETAAVRPDAISTMGSSMGSTLAIIGCANDAACRTAIAISPGWAYYDISVEASLATHPVLVVYAERDRWPALGVPQMLAVAPDTVTPYTYPGNAHGMNLLRAERATFTVMILDWLAQHGA